MKNNPETNPAKLQKKVDYLTGVTTASAQDAMIEWSHDDHIRLYRMDYDKNVATDLIFDVIPSRIEYVSGSMSMLVFHIDGKSYNVVFSRVFAEKILHGGLFGLLMAKNDYDSIRLEAWVVALKRASVDTTKVKSWRWALKSSSIAVALILGIFIVASIIAGIVMITYTSQQY